MVLLAAFPTADIFITVLVLTVTLPGFAWIVWQWATGGEF